MTTDAALQALGHRVRSIRRDACLTQFELAQRATISRSYVAQIEKGTKAASFLVLKRIADALDVSIEELLGDEAASEYLRELREERERYRHATEAVTAISTQELAGTRRGILLNTTEGMSDEEVERLIEFAESMKKQHKETDA